MAAVLLGREAPHRMAASHYDGSCPGYQWAPESAGPRPTRAAVVGP